MQGGDNPDPNFNTPSFENLPQLERKFFHESIRVVSLRKDGTKQLTRIPSAQDGVEIHHRPLTQDEVIRSQEINGPNTVKSGQKRTWYSILLGALFHPFNILLLFLAVISGVSQEFKTMAVMLLMVILSALLRFYQEMRSEYQAEGLLKFVAARVLVIRWDPILRKENEYHLPASELVPGDWIRLAPGDLVPADVEVIEDKEFHVSQAALSGEALPVHKCKQNSNKINIYSENGSATTHFHPSAKPSLDRPLLSESSRKLSFESAKDLFIEKSKKDPEAGALTSDLENPGMCLLGSAVISGAAVCRVVRIGSKTLFGQLAELLAKQKQPNAFERGVRNISKAFFWTSITMATLVFGLQGLLSGKWYQAVIFGLSVAVGLTPEMLPMVVNTCLSKGAVSLSKKRCIVKKLDAVVNIGAMKILCTDKTGTLTTSSVNLHRFINRNGDSSTVPLHLGYLSSRFQSVQDSPLDAAIIHYYQNEHISMFSGSNSPFRASPQRRSSRPLSSSSFPVGFASRFNLLDEIPFDFIRRRMSVILHDHVTEGTKAVMICKGAVEEVLSLCTRTVIEDTEIEDILALMHNEVETEPLTSKVMKELEYLNEKLIKEGFRLLAVAYRNIDIQEGYTNECEQDFTFAGYLAFLDPPKESAGRAIAQLVENGVHVKVLTGDSPLVCKKVCDEIGIRVEGCQITTGQELSELKPEFLRRKALTCKIFAKLTPVQKADIVRILQMDGYVVGFLGDGINDAAALTEADVGISVDTGTDVAKESSDIILLDKDLTVIAEAVLTGRRTFGNTMKYIVITVSSNFGNVFSILTASAWLRYQPIGSFHILIQNLLYDLSQMSIPWDNMDEEYLKKSHKWSTTGILKFMMYMGPWSSVFDIITFMFLYFYFDIRSSDDEHGIRVFQTTWFTVGLLTQSVIVHVIRTPKLPFIQSRASCPVVMMTLLVITTGLALPFIPGVVDWIGMTRLPWEVYPFIAVTVVSYCIVAELAKKLYLHMFKKWY